MKETVREVAPLYTTRSRPLMVHLNVGPSRKKVKVCIDTVEGRSVARHSFVRRLGLTVERQEGHFMRVANNRLVGVVGTCKMGIWIEGKEVELEVWVVEELSKDLLLGKLQLHQLGCELKFNSGLTEVKLGGKIIAKKTEGINPNQLVFGRQ